LAVGTATGAAYSLYNDSIREKYVEPAIDTVLESDAYTMAEQLPDAIEAGINAGWNAGMRGEQLGALPEAAEAFGNALEKRTEAAIAAKKGKTVVALHSGAGAPEATRKRIMTAYQCYLLYNADWFRVQHKKLLSGGKTGNFTTTKPDGSPADYIFGKKGAIRTPAYYSRQIARTRMFLVNDESLENDTTIANRIKMRPNQAAFENITPSDYARLTPRLRIYKVYHPQSQANRKVVEMEFDSKTDLSGITSKVSDGINDVYTRGSGVGIESFEWKYIGTDPFTATRDLEATLKMHFQSFPELTKPRTGTDQNGNDSEYRYLDLILQGNCSEGGMLKVDGRALGKLGSIFDSDRPAYDPGCYEIMVEVGYNAAAGTSTDASDLTNSIREQRQKLYLVLTEHELDMGQDGTFGLTIKFRARLGAHMSNKTFNVIIPGGGFDTTGPAQEIKKCRQQFHGQEKGKIKKKKRNLKDCLSNI